MRWNAERILGVAIFILVIVYLYIHVGSGQMFSSYDVMSRPEFWPRVMLLGLLVTGLLKILAATPHSPTRPEKTNWRQHLLVPRALIGIFIVAAYCYITQYAGFAFATLIFIPIFMWYLGARSPKLLIFTPVISLIAVLLLFWRFLYVAVPKGYGIFLSFSNMLLSLVRIGAS